MDPNSEEFAALPPHWSLDDPMSNEKIQEAMKLMFVPILQRWGGTQVDPTGVLLFCLASVVWHSDFLKATAARDAGHPFNMIPILSNPELLRDLKELVTLEPKGQVKSATGIPPHIEHATMAKKILHLCETTLHAVKDMATSVKRSVKEAFEEKAEENGQVSGERLKTMFEEHEKNVAELIDSKLSELRESFPITLAQEQDVGGNDDTMPFAEGDDDEVLVEQPNQVPT